MATVATNLSADLLKKGVCHSWTVEAGPNFGLTL